MDCPYGIGFVPGSEHCDFCELSDICWEEWERELKKEADA